MTTETVEAAPAAPKPKRARRRKAAETAEDRKLPLLAVLAARQQWRGLVVPARPVFVRECRAFVRSALDAWNLSELADAVLLCASELATNAMCYGDGEFIGISLVLSETELALEAYDQGSGEPFANTPETNAEYGRGVALMRDLSSNWGTDTMRSFTDMEQRWKRVWCSFTLPA